MCEFCSKAYNVKINFFHCSQRNTLHSDRYLSIRYFSDWYFQFCRSNVGKKKKKKRHFSPTLDFIVIYLLLHWRTLQMNFFLIFTKQLFILYNLRTIWIKFDPLPRHRKSKADIIITNPPLGFQSSEWLVGGSERFIRATCSSVRYQKPAEGIADEFSFPCGHWGQKPSQTWWKDWRETL